MNADATYDVAVIGGGLAGLALSVQLAEKGWQVVLLEKEMYPFHRVCGEYISNESAPFLERLGIPLSQLNLPQISLLNLTAPDGTAARFPLPLGGFGISRYTLDALLASRAAAAGVQVWQQAKVSNVSKTQGGYSVTYRKKNQPEAVLAARFCAGTFGKRSNLDVRWERPFTRDKSSRLANYIGIKYHVKAQAPETVISLHNFKDGYCGFSKVDDNTFSLCYLTRAAALKRCGNSIERLETEILSQNPALKQLFQSVTKLEGFPVTISQVSFRSKSLVEDGVVLAGDAAGMIAPLCGNGMSMALHASFLLAEEADRFLAGALSFEGLLINYRRQWNHHFRGRLRRGRFLQRFFGSPQLSNAFVGLFRRFPALARPLVRSTHGQPY